MTEILLAGEEQFEQLRRPFIAGYDHVIPHAIVRISAPRDVTSALAFARERSLPIAIRCGGHSAAGFSSTHGVLIDVTPLASIELVGRNRVRVGAGVLTGRLNSALVAAGLTIPVGTCPSVGIAGLTLGGGFGHLGRKHGFTCDQVEQAEIVLAGGEIATCDANHDADLFWALRGGGTGNFGVVTSLTFEAQPIPLISMFELTWGADCASAVVNAWQQWMATAPDELSAELVLNAPANPTEPVSVELQGALLGSAAQATDLLAHLQNHAGPARSFSCMQTSYEEALRRQSATSVTDASTTGRGSDTTLRQGHRISKSALFRSGWEPSSTHRLVEHLQLGRQNGVYRSIELAAWGGAYNRVSATATSFVHRDSAFSVQHTALLNPDAPVELKQDASQWVTQSWNIVQLHSTGAVYPNFPDRALTYWQHRYYGDNFQQLCQIKRKYDPDNVFTFQQSIPLSA